MWIRGRSEIGNFRIRHTSRTTVTDYTVSWQCKAHKSGFGNTAVVQSQKRVNKLKHNARISWESLWYMTGKTLRTLCRRDAYFYLKWKECCWLFLCKKTKIEKKNSVENYLSKKSRHVLSSSYIVAVDIEYRVWCGWRRVPRLMLICVRRIACSPDGRQTFSDKFFSACSQSDFDRNGHFTFICSSN